MLAILFVLVLGTAVNAHNGGAETLGDFINSAEQQIKHPVITPADYSKLNQ